MGSQTKALKKPTYKELEKQPFLARITAKLEMNNHDGYCSGDECKYTKKIVKANIVVPDEFKDFPVGRCDIRKRGCGKIEYKWANHLPLPDVNYSGSEYCECHKPEGGVGKHEYRYTIKKVEIVENNKYKAEIVAPSIEENLNAKLEELQKQEDDLTIQYEEAQSAREAATRKLEEAKVEIEELNKKSLDIKTRQNEVKEEIKKNKIEIAKKNNKNGYVILAHDDHCKEQVYGFTQRFEEAQTIAEEAVEFGSRRLEKRPDIETDFKVGAKIEALWTKDNKWYEATITKVPGDNSQAGKKYISKFAVKWTEGELMSWGLELHQLRTKDYNKINKFNSARIVDLDTQIEVEEYGVDNSNSNTYIEW
jgi:hypothetical protein